MVFPASRRISPCGRQGERSSGNHFLVHSPSDPSAPAASVPAHVRPHQGNGRSHVRGARRSVKAEPRYSRCRLDPVRRQLLRNRVSGVYFVSTNRRPRAVIAHSWTAAARPRCPEHPPLRVPLWFVILEEHPKAGDPGHDTRRLQAAQHQKNLRCV